ncbi:heat-inducible transcriptional repressor HrcA [Anaerocolumna aminovalerica]|jgi:heat-inducible transcriptional repressor|uniref:Heat-inducible transcription repressor HrcA n=1 Tax=Anaerocolumna aminovalerica TaxID=1527 RepID=A0A1I5CYQ2_9FIRM|nr:heat-inducible transcriptional repressor HrcA [Anaerocolumna aminovalerica]MBU5331305.1 heat-inducible transcriptional repressor HrcA [Anaerocolumna aminovalerica]MDU6264355.1 heat-inducible transcriptional repressor HrcA [Anaerocolumna aminovalerica]SFN92092.1 heat-inducible transcription repressor HrcA [Anaerocolumna aminovalerica]
MVLDDRKLKILQAIIQNYLETGEPVGSRTISKLTDLNLSSATIRNEMADLEEQGYIIQPHTSAGRIPSDKGYRLYVDTMLQDKIQEVEDMKVLLVDKADKIDTLLKQIAKLLAANTNYATLVTKPQYRSRKVKFIQLTEVDDDQILAVILLEGNIVKNKIIDTLEKLDKEIILKLNIVFNTFLQGLDLSEINLTIIQKMKEQAGSYSGVVSDILDAIAQAISEEKNVEIYTSGATNMLKYPELSDMDKVSELLNTFEEKNQLTELVAASPSEDSEKRGIQVYIGSETPVEAMKDCSVVTATYEIEDGVYGKIGIIGPKRMDYEKVVSTLHTLMVQLDEIFKKKT